MIFPPHNVAKAILTANTEILPWPSLFNDDRKKIERDVIWRTSNNLVCHFLLCRNHSTLELLCVLCEHIHFKKCYEYNSTHTSEKLSLWYFLYSKDSRIFKLFFVYSTCSKDGLVAIHLLWMKITEHSFHWLSWNNFTHDVVTISIIYLNKASEKSVFFGGCQMIPELC